MSPNCQVGHPSANLAIVCQCPRAQCIPCLDAALKAAIYAEDLSWSRCPTCKSPYQSLRLEFANRTFTEWLNRAMANLFCVLALRLFSLSDWKYHPTKWTVRLLEYHLYQMLALAALLGALLYSDYCLLAIWLPNVNYLIRRHFYRFDYVIGARFDPAGPSIESMSNLMLRLDLYSVAGTVAASSLVMLFRLSQGSFWTETLTMLSSVYS